VLINGSINLSTESRHVNSFQGFPVAGHRDDFIHITDVDIPKSLCFESFRLGSVEDLVLVVNDTGFALVVKPFAESMAIISLLRCTENLT